MGRLSFFFKYALNNLLKGGQRVLVAILAVTFGVMSLITMLTTASSVSDVMLMAQHIELGGDMLATHNNIDLEQMGKFDYLLESNVIEAYTPVQEYWGVTLRTLDNGQAIHIQRGFGIDPKSYPLYGELEIDGKGTISDLLQDDNAVLITRDIAQMYGLSVGDVLRISSSGDQFVDVVITGIVNKTPILMGDRIYYNLNLAERLRPDEPAFDYVAMRTSAHDIVTQELSRDGWALQVANHEIYEPDGGAGFFLLMLRGSGVLGLIVGGIGIANTMQVLLTQRRTQVGIFKTLGYTQRDLLMMFGIEAGLLGLVGSVLGGIIAIFTSQIIAQTLANTSTMMLDVSGASTLLLIGGVVIGVLTTLIFAFQAILKTSRTRPSVIFRQDTAQQSTKWDKFSSLMIYAVLLLPFALITSFIMQSVLNGVGVLLVVLAGLIGFTILLGFSTWVILRLMPTLGNNFLFIARNNMRKRALGMLFSMIALFIGIVTAGFSMLIFETSFEQFDGRQDRSTETANLKIQASQTDRQAIEQILTERGVERVSIRYEIPLNMDSYHTLEAHNDLWNIEIVEGAPFSNSGYGVYLERGRNDDTMQTLEIVLDDGNSHSLPVLGYYRNLWNTVLNNGSYVPLISIDTMEQLGITAESVNIYAFTNLAQESAIASEIGMAFPNSLTELRTDIIETSNRQFMNFLYFAGAMAGLAFLAGLMLMANVVSLGMIERRYEIGVLKAVGYTRRNILTLFVLEYGMMGFITSLLGVLGVQVILLVLGVLGGGFSSYIGLSLWSILAILIGGTALIVTTVLMASWSPSGVRPMVILNRE